MKFTEKMKSIILKLEKHFEKNARTGGTPKQLVIDTAKEKGFTKSQINNAIDKLKRDGFIYEPRLNYLLRIKWGAYEKRKNK